MIWAALLVIVVLAALLTVSERALSRWRREALRARGVFHSLEQQAANREMAAFRAGFERGVSEGSAGLMSVSAQQCDCPRCQAKRRRAQGVN